MDTNHSNRYQWIPIIAIETNVYTIYQCIYYISIKPIQSEDLDQQFIMPLWAGALSVGR